MQSHNQGKRLINVLGIIVLCLASFYAGFQVNDLVRGPDVKLMRSAFRAISNDSIYNQLTPSELSYTAVRGMLSSIEDPYAELIEPQAAQNFSNTFRGQTGVVGLYAENIGGPVVVSIVFPGGPADHAGVLAGDIILAIDDVTLDSDTDSSEAGLMMRGLPGTTMHLKIKRADQVLEYDLVRQEREYVDSRILQDGIGYIALNAFNRTATEQMQVALEELMKQRPAGIIWDLRNNEGGDMQAAQDILSFFIEDGLLFSAKLTHNQTVEFKAKGNAIAADIPLVVLMNKTTYSSAETCAAAISETGRGKTIGSNSYGKGLIQATIPLLNDTLLQMTIARWISPNGEWYQDRGVSPQIEVSDDPSTTADELLQTAIEVISQAYK